jgi:hypothetical protein
VALFLRLLMRDFVFFVIAIVALGFSVGGLYATEVLVHGRFEDLLNWKVIGLLVGPGLVYPLLLIAFWLDPLWEQQLKAVRNTFTDSHLKWNRPPRRPNCDNQPDRLED